MVCRSQEFQSTLPRGERHIGQFFAILGGKFQSTLPRGERRSAPYAPSGRCTISIHAPARGATQLRSVAPGIHRISIHAPARGATVGRSLKSPYFPISIHAPARGATNAIRLILQLRTNFNPRSREGSDVHAFDRTIVVEYFNPRSREGSDSVRFRNLKAFRFQSTLPRGERPVKSILITGCFVFQSTLPRGERPYSLLDLRCKHLISIHAPARGATRKPLM